MRGLLIRAGFGLAPMVVLGAVALSTGPGRHRLVILGFAVLLGVVLSATTGEARAGGRSGEPVNPGN